VTSEESGAVFLKRVGKKKEPLLAPGVKTGLVKKGSGGRA